MHVRYNTQESTMTQKILKISPVPEEATVNDIIKIMKNFRISQVKIKNGIAYTKFSDFSDDVYKLLQKEFPNGLCELEGWKMEVALLEAPLSETELNEVEYRTQSPRMKHQNDEPQLQFKRSLQRKHTVELNLPGDIQDPTGLQFCLQNNKIWAAEMIKQEPNYFKKLIDIQKPKYLWIGCADSRVPANEIVGLKPGQLFVHRNVANIVSPSDVNALAVIQYAVEYLEVEDIIVTGHYGCGGVKASFKRTDYGLLEAWLSNLRQIRARYHDILDFIDVENERVNKLVQLNVQTQVLNLSRIPLVQRAWKKGKKLRLHGLVYRLEDGILRDLKVSMDSIHHIPEEYRIVQ